MHLLVRQPTYNPIVILACACGAVALQESPAKSDAEPVRWQRPAPAICPDCLHRAIRRNRPKRVCEPTELIMPA